MKFSCEKETLLNLLNIASRAVTGKSSMPLLEGLLLAETRKITHNRRIGYSIRSSTWGNWGKPENPQVWRGKCRTQEVVDEK